MNNIVIPAIRNRIMTTQRTDNENGKTDRRYEGPFVVRGVTKNGNYILTDKTCALLSRDVLTSHIKRIFTGNVVNNRADQKQYDVQAIIQHKENNTSDYKYLLRWKCYPPEYDTWEPVSCFDDMSMIEQYWARHNINNNIGKPIEIMAAFAGSNGYSMDFFSSVFIADCSVYISSARFESSMSQLSSTNASPVTLSISASQLVIPMDSTDVTTASVCMFGIAPLSRSGTIGSNIYLVGDSVLRSAYMVFDIGNNRIGLAASKGVGGTVTSSNNTFAD
ncbi:hypothetical protein G6F37_011493 [Rhizopus arrhizus]|nr:hypothetical protein G6F38_011562 [Rhizopus arrhizus]KAG1149039.1 hypothetical protein G6F37_011493 [Rhizopus arrhizus]